MIAITIVDIDYRIKLPDPEIKMSRKGTKLSIIMGNDIRTMNHDTPETLMNPEII